jgi:hypothetical protein
MSPHHFAQTFVARRSQARLACSSMTRLTSLFYAILSLAGCQISSARELEAADLIVQTGDRAAGCAAMHKAAEAFHREGNNNYGLHKAAANSYCLAYQLDKEATSLATVQ